MRWMIRLSSVLSSAALGARASWNTGAPALLRYTIEDQAMQMDVEIGRRAEALDERDCAAVSLATFASRLFDQKGGNDAVDDLQQWGEQIGMGGQQDARAASETRAPIGAPAPAG